ncbi:Maintenance of ploidy protein mob1 [Exophiala bonariae]|uniref:Maintenance of ploidy protein mob1 n=1 Tax=Exophiala bonariae TaxID=1690606 RepID=A0AAV9N1L1_9EURO|nr:Maintenance of ploidy protein mob1 [Exophiala bonariae]
MTSLLTTMFVPLTSSPVAQALPPHCTLKQSSSCVTINSYTFLDSPEPSLISSYSPTSRAEQLLRSSAFGSPSPSPTKPQKSQSSSIDPSSPFSNARTRGQFKPRNATKGTTSYQLRQFAEATLGSGSLRQAVKLPEGEDLNEWLAVNVVDFYNQINLLYGSITEFCSPQTCPEMKATDEFEYLWQDAASGYSKPTKMPAPEYIEHLMTWVQSNIDNESTFPSRIGVPFPKHFPSTVRQLFKRLYRVYAHIYCHHYQVIGHLGLEPHLNTSFKHYVLFIDEHDLAKGGGKDYWGPLGDLVDSMLKSE